MIGKITTNSNAKLVSDKSEEVESGIVETAVLTIPPKSSTEIALKLWLGFLHFPEGDWAQLNLMANCIDSEAETEFRRLWKSIRKTIGNADALAAVRESIAFPIGAGPVPYCAGPLSLELTGDYVLPKLFHFKTQMQQRFSLKLVDDPVELIDPVPGTISTVTDLDGNPVRVWTTRNLWNQRPSASRKQNWDSTFVEEANHESTQPFVIHLEGRPVHLELTVDAGNVRVNEMKTALQEHFE